ncbi:hypothetical protein [Streptomyces lunalinharesii]|uniref:Secreted protein n=1 Tax=Streptomyces lunalinharesii TaxID=333384 RepID=A0ABN3SXV4_9ACTN
MPRTTPAAHVAAAAAAALCLGGVLTGCGSAAGSGYAAVGAAGPTDPTAPPRGGVELTPLPGNDATSGPTGSPGSPGTSGPPSPPGSSGPSGPNAPGATGTTPPGSPTTPPAGQGNGNGHHGPGSNTPPPSDGSPAPQPGGSTAPEPPSPTIPAGPNAPSGLVVGKPALADTDVRWCQRVTIDFLNTGPRPVTTGTVTFGSHVIGALGIDWATLDSTRALPLPLPPGKPAAGSWRVCVDAWRVPLGMHLDTKDVTFKWK